MKTDKYGLPEIPVADLPPIPPGPRKITSTPPISKDEEIINQISKIREKNNHNWMKILQIAIISNPEETKDCLKNINKCDGEINKLTNELAG